MNLDVRDEILEIGDSEWVTGYDRFCRLSEFDGEEDEDMAFNTVIWTYPPRRIREGSGFLRYSEPLGWRFYHHIRCDEGGEAGFLPQLGH